MEALVVIEAVAIALLGVLVAGLLRSHAEILRTLHRLGAGVGDTSVEAPKVRQGRAAHTAGTSSAIQAVDLVGTTPAGEAIQVGVRGARTDTLLAFLSSGCGTCGEFWRAFREPASLGLPAGTRLVVVTKSPAEESVSRLRQLAPSDVPVVLSTEAWQSYGVPVTPYFMHVDGPTGQIVGQGTGGTWPQVRSLLRQATADDRHNDGDRRTTVAEVEAEVDRRLLAAGIHPGDPSLYPSRQQEGPA